LVAAVRHERQPVLDGDSTVGDLEVLQEDAVSRTLVVEDEALVGTQLLHASGHSPEPEWR
jgi:hypothetical protein